MPIIVQAPIWRDTAVSFGAAESAPFQISADGEVIYSGEVFRRPGTSELSVRINDVCADYLGNPLPDLSGSVRDQAAPELVRAFGVQVLMGSSVSEMAEVTFTLDWSYDLGRTLAGLANDPIVPLLDIRQKLVATVYGGITIMQFAPKEGLGVSYIIGTGMQGGYNSVFNLGNPGRVFVGGLPWDVEETCARHALYYLNAYGGWDTLVMRGASSVSDAVERSTAWRDYDNADPRNRGRVNWRNAVTRTWTMHTGWLTDEQAAKMHHLLESPDVYLMDLETGEVRAVVLTNTDAPVKTFKGEGRRLVDYTITAQSAQDMERR